MPPSVLVTDAEQRKAVPIIRALGRAGVRVVAGESARWAMGFYSRHCGARAVYPPPEDEAAFVDWLIAQAKAGRFDTVLPVDERTMAPITRWREELRRHLRVPVVVFDTYMIARDKRRTVEAARTVGVAVPRTWSFASTAELRAHRAELPAAAVVKPRTGSGSRGIRYVRAPGELEAVWLAAHRRAPEPLVQEWIPPGGDTLGVELLLDGGDVVAHFMHRRLREYPVSGGPSTLRESVYDKALVQEAARLLSWLGWHGVAMVEFKVDPRDGVPKLMEINAKFWGSIALPILCGVDFPVLLARLARGERVQGPRAYPVGVQSRWLIPGDLMHFATNPHRLHLRPGFFDFSAADDLLDRRDLGPVAGMLLSFLSRAWTTHFWADKVLRTR